MGLPSHRGSGESPGSIIYPHRGNAMCPICLSIVAATERDLLSHLLAAHPAALLALTTLLGLANAAVIGRPELLLLLDLGVYLAAVLIARRSLPGYPL